MSREVRDGWIHGELPGPRGKAIPVRHFRQPPFVDLAPRKPNLVLHTTETDGYIDELEYPTQFQVGGGFIGQHKPLSARGEGTDTQDAYAMQVEIVGRSKRDVWLPGTASLEPLVALVAFLHANGYIRTGLGRPTNEWPMDVWDSRGSDWPATDRYYRRRAGLWPDVAGIYGHLELPDDEHWDPGGFDYPAFFALVREVLEDDMTEEEKAELKEALETGRELRRINAGMLSRLQGEPQPEKPGPRLQGWEIANQFLSA